MVRKIPGPKTPEPIAAGSNTAVKVSRSTASRSVNASVASDMGARRGKKNALSASAGVSKDSASRMGALNPQAVGDLAGEADQPRATTPSATALGKTAGRSPQVAERGAAPLSAAHKQGLTEEHIGTAHKAPRTPRMIRDSFTMPESEYARLGDVKKSCLKAGYKVKKSELLRVGVALVSEMDVMALKDQLAALVPRKAGRPKNE